MSKNSIMSGWPSVMYTKDGELHCLACKEIFKTEANVEQQNNHYRNKSSSSNSLSANQHGILLRMHQLKKCLLCTVQFDISDPRIMFDHHKQVHPEEDMSTIEGYVRYVRKFPLGFLNTSEDQKNARKANFKAVFVYLQLRIKTSAYSIPFKEFMGYRDSKLSSSELWAIELCPLLTVYPADFFPIHPDNFLCDRQYNEDTMSLTRDEWNNYRVLWQGLYGEGEI